MASFARIRSWFGLNYQKFWFQIIVIIADLVAELKNFHLKVKGAIFWKIEFLWKVCMLMSISMYKSLIAAIRLNSNQYQVKINDCFRCWSSLTVIGWREPKLWIKHQLTNLMVHLNCKFKPSCRTLGSDNLRSFSI